MATAEQRSPFLHTSPTAEEDNLAILHLKRDNLIAVTLRSRADDGYVEGAVINTRFGSFPHNKLIGEQFGSQVRASKVDTGSRGRKKVYQIEEPPKSVSDTASDTTNANNKRKAENELVEQDQPSSKKVKRQQQDLDDASNKQSSEAGSGFAHLLSPTAEAWTYSLDHRTQVVYVPDYSYILSRLRVKPGEALIEAGAGSGSFTHAAVRAVFNGYPDSTQSSNTSKGRIYSFEYHEPRVKTLQQELLDHKLNTLVQLTHRDVCNDGFKITGLEENAPRPTAVFLDLPSPWLALRHLVRSPDGLLNTDPIRLCAFSPCIEQVTSTISALREAGWIEIEMVEVQNHRIDVRRERIGLKEEGLRGVNAVASSVEESLERLRQVDSKLKDFHRSAEVARKNGADAKDGKEKSESKPGQSKAARLEKIKLEAQQRKLYKEGNLVHRTEAEVKTHTSYLVFAVLPRAWSDEDEKRYIESTLAPVAAS